MPVAPPGASRAPWPHPVAAGALALLLALSSGAAARGIGAWARPVGGDRPGPGRMGQAAVAPRAPAAAARDVAPLVAADPTRLLVDVADRRRPGEPRLLSLPRGASLADLLRAGGLAPGAPVGGAPPAGAPLTDGLVLVIEADGIARMGRMPAARRLRLGLPLDVDADSAADLALLPGLGPVLAARIVEDRRRRGPFRHPEALGRVPGIGPVTLERLRGRIVAGRRDPPPPGLRPAGRPEAEIGSGDP